MLDAWALLWQPLIIKEKCNMSQKQEVESHTKKKTPKEVNKNKNKEHKKSYATKPKIENIIPSTITKANKIIEEDWIAIR